MALAALALPLLMGAKGGCGRGDISMGNDMAGAAGEHGDETGGTSPGSGGAVGLAGSPATGGAVGLAGSPATGGAGATCAGYENTSFVDEVTVRYVNAGSEPIFVGRTHGDRCDDEQPFLLFNEADERIEWSAQPCITCASLQLGPPSCPTICLRGPLVRIDPGGSFDFSWTGNHYQAVDMPEECYGAEGFSGQCSKIVQAAAGSYRFVGTAWSALNCAPPGDNCSCNPTDSGACQQFDGFATGTPRQISAELSYPTDKFVELRFE